MKSPVVLALAALLLAGCRLAEVEVAAPHAPGAVVASVNRPPDLVDLQNGGPVIVQDIAYPHFVFAPDTAYVELFPQDVPPSRYVIANRDAGFHLRLPWDGLWLAGAQGALELTVQVNVQPPGDEVYETWARVSTGAIQETGAVFRNELLDVPLSLTEPGVHRLQALLTATGQAVDDGKIVRSAEIRMDLLALSPPDAAPAPSEADFRPAFGDLEAQGILLDWRAWAFGPCSVHADAADLNRILDDACTALGNGDLEAVRVDLQQALDRADEDRLRAFLRNQLGVLAAVQGQWPLAARHFREALDLWFAQGQAIAVAIALRNLGVTLIVADRLAEGDQFLGQSAQLSEQIGDFPGVVLAQAQLGLVRREEPTVQEAIAQMEEMGLPQAETVRTWWETQKR